MISYSDMPTLETPWTVACQTLLSMGFLRQEYWSGLPFPSPGDLPNSGIKPRSPELQVDSLPSKSPGKPKTEQKYTHRDRSMLSCDRFFATLWTVACQAPLWDSPGKNTGVGCYALLQGIFLTQGSNSCLLCLLHCRQIPYLLSPQGSPHDNKHIINTFIYLFQSQRNL